eukprot:gene9704-biopygen21258
MWRRRRHQDSQQACNAPTHHIAIQDTSLQWHSTLGLVPHLMGPTAGGLISQSQTAVGDAQIALPTPQTRMKLHQLCQKMWGTGERHTTVQTARAHAPPHHRSSHRSRTSFVDPLRIALRLVCFPGCSTPCVQGGTSPSISSVGYQQITSLSNICFTLRSRWQLAPLPAVPPWIISKLHRVVTCVPHCDPARSPSQRMGAGTERDGKRYTLCKLVCTLQHTARCDVQMQRLALRCTLRNTTHAMGCIAYDDYDADADNYEHMSAPSEKCRFGCQLGIYVQRWGGPPPLFFTDGERETETRQRRSCSRPAGGPDV